MEPPSTHRVSVLNQTGKRISSARLKQAVEKTISRHTSKPSSVCVLLTTDENIRDLNSRYRNLDEPTDVLSFPAGDFPGAPLGDIAIAVPFAERQASLRRVPLETELCYLAIHGALHLLGFDDEEDEARARMQREMHLAGIDADLPADPEWSSLLGHGKEDDR